MIRLFPAVLLLLLIVPPPVLADIYTYVDKNGVCHYTNVPGDRRYRLLKPEQGRTGGRISAGKLSVLESRSKRAGYAGGAELNHYIDRAARKLRLDPHLIRAVIKTESNFDRYAVSSKGAKGLMQLMPGTARSLRVHDPFDPWQNIYGGSRYLRDLMNCYNGDVVLGLAAYNAGPGRVKADKGLPRIAETRAYVAKVLRTYRAYKGEGASPLTSISLRKMVTVK